MALPIPSNDQIRQEIETEIGVGAPTQASFFKNSSADDMFILPLTSQVSDNKIIGDYINRCRSLDEMELVVKDVIYQERLRTALNLTVSELRNLISTDINDLVGNWNVFREDKKFSIGYVRLYSNSNAPLTFQAGQTISTIDLTVDFLTLNGFVNIVPALDSIVGLYYIDCPVQCSIAGEIGNQIPGRLRVLKAPIAGIVSVTNNIPTELGSDVESDIELISRARLSWRSRVNNVVEGLMNNVLTYPGITDVSVVFFGDPLMLRESRGAVDIYVIAENKIQNAEVVIDSVAARYIYEVVNDETTFEVYPTSFFSGNDLVFKMPSQPVLSISAVAYKTSPSGSYTSLASSNYYLISDTLGVFQSSIKGNDVIVIKGGSVPDGSFIKVTYTYNRILKDLTALMETLTNKIPGADLLFKLGEQLNVDITLTPTILASFDVPTVKNVIISDLTAFFFGGTDSNNKTYLPYKLGQPLDKSDLLDIILNVEGVDRVDLDTFAVNIQGTPMSNQFQTLVTQFVRLNSVTYNDPIILSVNPITNKTTNN